VAFQSRYFKGGAPIAWHRTRLRLVSNSKSGFQFWDGHGKRLSTAIQPDASTWSIAWSPDGEQLAFGHQNDGLVEIWEPGGKRLMTLKGPEGTIGDIAWSPNGNTLAIRNGDRTAQFWDPDGTPGPVIPSLTLSLAWHPTSTRLAVAGDNASGSAIWNLDGTRGPELKGQRGVDFSVDWSPDGKRLVTGSSDRTVRLWSDEGTPQAVLREHDAEIWAVDWSPTGTFIASAADDGTVIVWDAETTEPVWVGVQLRSRESATFSAAGQVLDGDPDVLEEHFVYIVENEDGRQELLKPSEFRRRIAESAVGKRPSE
jgi:WD40 repeat protein